MVLIDSLAEKLFGVIKGFGHQIKLYTVEGSETVDPKDARRFFSADSGLMVTIDEENNEVQLSTSNEASIDETKKLQQNIKKLSNEFLMNYTVRNYGKSIQPRDFAYKAKIARNNNVSESEETKNMELAMKNVSEGISGLSGSKKTSHQTLENVKILVKHKKEVDEDVRGSRSRNIQAIFLEQNGERFRFPHNNLNGARAMARHMTEGGLMLDKVGSYIIESVSNLIQLNEFLRYAKTNKLVNEDTTDIVQTVRENVNSIRTELHRLTGVKTYESIKARIEEEGDMELQESDIDGLRDMFTVKRFDEKFDEVLPIVNRLVQEKTQFLRRIEESAAQTIYVGPQLNNIDAIFEFANDEAQLGHKISEMASRMVENAELSNYVSKVGQKLCKEGAISAFEQEIVTNVLGNICEQPVQEEQTQIQESANFEEFFDKYTYTFV